MDRNEVVLVGRLSAAAEEQVMPSGDTVTKWRVIVRRRWAGQRPGKRGGSLADSIPCVTFDAATAEIVRGLKPRDRLEVKGSVRCRVYGPPGAKMFRYEVEARSAAPLPPAPPEATEQEPSQEVGDAPSRTAHRELDGQGAPLPAAPPETAEQEPSQEVGGGLLRHVPGGLGGRGVLLPPSPLQATEKGPVQATGDAPSPVGAT
ncbi:single-stranded DNA-binding protein [Nonomuraea pusilla]|uniref:Single-stranded DNA-binding protein n=1 Tax=Nonomuraea pusilla TaxID=46177 RepID=A0A1H7UVD7_9ACTN|nr:single-stranded DNA-binding protein [Nonomuraea pusilla]SEM00901.1 Single-stranded DNA-binding protein [Nonomuraea pusilla]